MSGRNENGSVRLPLIEAVIIIAVFAAVSVALMRMYVAADSLKGESVAISHATMLVRNKAEAIKSGETKLPDMGMAGVNTDFAPHSVAAVLAEYDSGWHETTDSSDAMYRMVLEPKRTTVGEIGTLTEFKVYICRTGADVDDEASVLAYIDSAVYNENK